MALVTDDTGVSWVSSPSTISLRQLLEPLLRHPQVGALPWVQREDGTWLLDGTLPVDVILSHFNFHTLPAEGEGHYYTLAGLVMYVLGKIPSDKGDHFTWEGHRFEVIDMDGRRVDKEYSWSPARGSDGKRQ